MDPDALANTVSNQFATAWDAPIPFLAALLFVGWLMYLLIGAHFKGRIETKDAIIEQKDALIGEYKDKLSGATPAEAQEQINLLRTEVATLKRQRSLTPQQREAITQAAMGQADDLDDIEIIYLSTSHEAAVFAADICDALGAANWDVHPDIVLAGGRLKERGLTLSVLDKNNLPRMANALRDGLLAAGLDFRVIEQPYIGARTGRLYVDLAD